MRIDRGPIDFYELWKPRISHDLVDYDYYGDKQVIAWGCLVWRRCQSGTRRSDEPVLVDNGTIYEGHTMAIVMLPKVECCALWDASCVVKRLKTLLDYDVGNS